MPLNKPVDSGYPKYPYRVSADVPADAPLLKVYDYGPLGARFFWRARIFALKALVSSLHGACRCHLPLGLGTTHQT